MEICWHYCFHVKAIVYGQHVLVSRTISTSIETNKRVDDCFLLAFNSFVIELYEQLTTISFKINFCINIIINFVLAGGRFAAC